MCGCAAEQYLGDSKALLLRANLLKYDFAQKQGNEGRARGSSGGGGGHHASAGFLGALGGLGGFVDA